ncbi:MAG: hypothetical protein QME96_18650, partial [Myxococcota bacterium]|nr:hypothetical protein [Myxococcota bacterium]
MERPDVAGALASPDGILMRPEHQQVLCNFVDLYTVPLLFFPEGTRVEDISRKLVRACGTGVLVQLEKRFFMLTAGHVARRFATSACLALGSRGRQRYLLPETRSSFCDRDDGGADYGYVEIPSTERVRFDGAGDRVF